MIDARALHGWLGVEARFADWIKRRAAEYGLEDGADYFSELRKNGGRGRAAREYLLTLDTAKELAMVERTDLGRQTRRYFIHMERAAQKMAADHVANGTAEAIPQEQ